MSVHHEISRKVNEVVNKTETYKKLDQRREAEIEAVLEKARNGEEFSLEGINRVTSELNRFAEKHHLPLRKLVTRQMVTDAIAQPKSV